MKLIKFLRDVIIAPHGVTDISHSIQTNNKFNLLAINGLMIGSTNLIINEYNLNNIIDFIFLTSSIIHFRHDMPNIIINNQKIPNYLLCFILLLGIYFLNSDFIIYYMVLFHVPNHYNLNKSFVLKDLNFNLILISLVAMVSVYFDFYLCNEYIDNDIYNLIKAIIISHVIYQEKFVLNSNY